MPAQVPRPIPEPSDYYFENGLLVYTAAFHLNRGACCGSGCRHCPFEPKHVQGNRVVALPDAGPSDVRLTPRD